MVGKELVVQPKPRPEEPEEDNTPGATCSHTLVHMHSHMQAVVFTCMWDTGCVLARGYVVRISGTAGLMQRGQDQAGKHGS